MNSSASSKMFISKFDDGVIKSVKKGNKGNQFETDDEKDERRLQLKKSIPQVQRGEMNIDFSGVDFHSEGEESFEDHNALVFLSEQANQNISELLNVIETRQQYVQSALRALEREIRQCYDTMQKEYFAPLAATTLKKIIDIGRTYVTSDHLQQARSILARASEMLEFYLKKNFQFLELKADLGNSLGMLEVRFGNYQQALQILDDTIVLQKKLNINGLGVSYMNKCKVLSLMNRHEEASRMARAALSEIKKDVDEFEQRGEVNFHSDSTVEENHLQNFDVAVMNFENAYSTGKDYLGEDDVLTQRVKLQMQSLKKSVIKSRKSEINHFQQYSKNKFLIKDRRLAAEDNRRGWLKPEDTKKVQIQPSLQIKSPNHKIQIRPTSSQPNRLQKSSLKSEVVSPPKNVKFTDQSQQILINTIPQPHRSLKIKTSNKTSSLNIEQKPLFQNTSKTTINKKQSQPDYFDNSDMYQSDAPSRAVKGFKDRDPELQRLEKIGVLSWVDDIGGPQAKSDSEVVIREPWEQEEIEDQEFYEVQKKNCSVFLDSIKNYQASSKILPPKKPIEQQKESKKIEIKIQLSEEKEQYQVQQPISVNQNNDDHLISSITTKEQPVFQYDNPEQQKSQQKIEITQQKKKQKDKPKGPIKNFGEQKIENQQKLMKQVENYLMQKNTDQQKLSGQMASNNEKAETMIRINKKKNEQIYGALLGLELLQERINEQTNKLEEMKKHEENQLKVIGILKNKSEESKKKYELCIKEHYAGEVILRWLKFSKIKRIYENRKLDRNSDWCVLDHYRIRRLPYILDQKYIDKELIGKKNPKKVKNNAKEKNQQKCYGLLAVLVDYNEHLLIIRFRAPTQSLEVDKKIIQLNHQVQFHELEYYFGPYRESERTRSIVNEAVTKIMSGGITADYIKKGLVMDTIDMTKRLEIQDEFGDLITLNMKYVRTSEVLSAIECKDQLMQQQEMTSQQSIEIGNSSSKFSFRLQDQNRKSLVSRVFRQEERLYKILVYSEGDLVFALLRYYGYDSNLYLPNNHFVLKTQIKRPVMIVKGMQINDSELPLYFEIDIENKLFNARPKALRIEDIITIQVFIRRQLAWKKLNRKMKTLYQFFLNVVTVYRDYKFWIRVFKDLRTHQYLVCIETLDVKEFMNEDQKRMQNQCQVDQGSARRLASYPNLMAYFELNAKKYTVKLMRLKLESLKDEDVRNLQRRLRRAVAKKNLKTKIGRLHQLIYRSKCNINGRQLFFRIFKTLDNDMQFIDVCDLVRTRNRKSQHKGRYYAKMQPLQYYLDMALLRPHPYKLFNYGFDERSIDYSFSIAKIQKYLQRRMSMNHNKKTMALEQEIVLQRRFLFKGTLLMVICIWKVAGSYVSYFLSLQKKRKQPGYLMTSCPTDFDTMNKTKLDSNRMQFLYEINIIERCVSIFIPDNEKVKVIQNYWLRRKTSRMFKLKFQTLFIGTNRIEGGERIFYYIFRTMMSTERILYAQSLKILKIDKKFQKFDRIKIYRRQLPKSLDVHQNDFTEKIFPVLLYQRVFFDYEMNQIVMIQQWGKLKFIQRQLKTKPKLLNFISKIKVMIGRTPYLFGFYQVNESKVFKIFLFALRPRRRLMGEKQYFLHETISYLLAEEIHVCESQFQTYIECDQQFRCYLKNIMVPQTGAMLLHQSNKIPISIVVNKQLQKLIISPLETSGTLLPGNTYLTTFDKDFLSKYTQDLHVFAYPWRSGGVSKLGCFRLQDIHNVYKIQRAFRSLFFKHNVETVISGGAKVGVRVAKSKWPNWKVVYQSPLQTSNQIQQVNAIFPKIILAQGMLESKSMVLRLEIWRESKKSLYTNEKFLGQTTLNYDDLIHGGKKEFIMEKQTFSSKGQGYLRITHAEELQRNMFTDYLKSGYKFHLTMALDFSFHNGTDNKNKNSQHYLDPRKKNQYELCLHGLTANLMHYLPKETVRLYGYAAIPPSNANMGNDKSDSFALTWDKSQHNMYGISSMLTSYHQAVRTVSPSGPPCFQQILINAKSFSSDLKCEKGFLSLMFLASSNNDDDDEEVSLKILSQLDQNPNLSIIIIGIGKFHQSSFVTEAINQGISYIHFYPLKDYLTNISELESNVMRDIRSDFLNYAQSADLEIELDYQQDNDQ